MAGIGFELKKMFQKKGILAIAEAYGYAGIVCTGPMILGIVLLLGIRALAEVGGASGHEKELLNSMVTYTLLYSLVLTNTLSLVTTRFTADQIYMEKNKRILPSFWGSISIMLVFGCITYGIFLWNAGIPIAYQLLCEILFGELIFVWVEINYLTAIKDYKGILLTFFLSLVLSWCVGFLLVQFELDIIIALMISVCVGYGVMMCVYYYLLIQYFPIGQSSVFYFLQWLDRYPQLSLNGLFISLGLFGHLVIMWMSPVTVQVQGLFYGAPTYDIPALLAFLSILVTTINFVTSVEVNFYPKYRNYFSLFNDGGSLKDIEQAEQEMNQTLTQELTYTFTKQFFATIVFIIVGTLVLPQLPLGMSDDMLGIYRVLCIGYAFYTIGNCIMLIQLYFSDNKGALAGVVAFMLVSCITSWLLKEGSIKLYGVGFLAGGAAFCVVALTLLSRYLSKVRYHVLCSQPIVAQLRYTWLSKFAIYMENRYQRKFQDYEIMEEDEV